MSYGGFSYGAGTSVWELTENMEYALNVSFSTTNLSFASGVSNPNLLQFASFCDRHRYRRSSSLTFLQTTLLLLT